MDRLQSPPVDRRAREAVGLEEVLDVREGVLTEGPDGVSRAGGDCVGVEGLDGGFVFFWGESSIEEEGGD